MDAVAQKRRLALRTIHQHAHAALQHQRAILALVREHGFHIPLPPDKPLLEVMMHVIVLKDSRPDGKPQPS